MNKLCQSFECVERKSVVTIVAKVCHKYTNLLSKNQCNDEIMVVMMIAIDDEDNDDEDDDDNDDDNDDYDDDDHDVMQG